MSWSTRRAEHAHGAAGGDPDRHHREQPGDQQQRARGGQPVHVVREAAQGLAVRRTHIEPRPLEGGRPRRLGERVLDRRNLSDRQHGDDDQVGRVCAQHLQRRVLLGVVAARDLTFHRRVRHRGAGRGRPLEAPASGVLGKQRFAWSPDAEERDDRGRCEQRGDDVGELDRDEVRAGELAESEGETAHDGHGPRLADTAAPVDHADQDQRHDQREEGRLATDHRAEVTLVEAGDLGQRGDRNGDCAESHRRRVGDEGDRGRLDRPEARGRSSSQR